MKKNHIVLGCVCAVFLLTNIFLLVAHQMVRYKLVNFDKIKEDELEKRLVVELQNIKKDLEEKHHADIVSYQAMAKRLELEKSKLKVAESNIKELTEDKKEINPKPEKSIKKIEKKKRGRR